MAEGLVKFSMSVHRSKVFVRRLSPFSFMLVDDFPYVNYAIKLSYSVWIGTALDLSSDVYAGFSRVLNPRIGFGSKIKICRSIN